MATRVPRRVRFTGAVLVMGLCLLCLLAGYVWWSTRLSRAIDRILVQHAQPPVDAPVELIPDEWLPDLAWEIARDRSELEHVVERIEGVLPPRLVPEAFRRLSPSKRRKRAADAMMAGREPADILHILEGVFPTAPTEGAEEILALVAAFAPPGHPRRTSLFLKASTHPDPAIRSRSLTLIEPVGQRPARSAEVMVRVQAMLDDQVSVVRERAGRVLDRFRTPAGDE